MKKILVMLVMLSLVLGIAAAQDGGFTVKGMVATGVRIQSGNEYDSYVLKDGHEKDKAYIDAYHDGEDHNFRAQIQADYKTENSGVSIRFRVDADSKAPNDIRSLINAGHAYGWFTFLPGGIAELSGGLLNNKKWGTYTDFYLDHGLDNRNFTKLDIRPIDGLSIGVNIVNPNVLAAPKMGYAFSGAVIGAEYTVPDMFGIRLEAMIGEKDAYSYEIGQDPMTSQPIYSNQRQGPLKGDLGLFATDKSSDFLMLWSGFYNGLEGRLRIDLEGALGVGKNAADKSMSAFAFGLMGNYGITEQLYAGLRAAFETDWAQEKNQAALQIRPQAGYTVNDWLKVELSIPITLVGGKGHPDYKGGLDAATTVIGVRPKAEFTINKNTSIEAWDLLLATTPKDGDTGIHNTVQLNLKWTF